MIEDMLLLRKIKEGDIKAFEQVFRLYFSPLRRYATRITGNEGSAEEIVQQLFYVFWKNRSKVNILQSLKSYLYGAVRNGSLQWLEHQDVCRRYISKQEGNSLILGSENEPEYNSPQGKMEYKELEKIFFDTLQNLPERRRSIYKMNRFEGKTYAEIADLFSISVKTVEAEMSKALSAFRKEIQNYMN